MTATASPRAGVPSSEAVMAQAQDENFPVASLVLGARRRAALMAIYGVARLIDDIGDEAPGDRAAQLDWADSELDRVFGETGAPEHPAMRALAVEARAFDLPAAPFRRLVEANRQDQVVTRYRTFEELIEYVTEHIQDVAEDYARGRVYVPSEDLARFACDETDLARPEPKARAVIAFEVKRARALLSAGAPLARRLPPRPRAAIAGFVAGGRATLDAIERASYDVWSAKPRRTRGAFAGRFAGALMGR
jgi:phytoene/squalene synthetase